jgi:hypothetical protein
MSWLIDSGKPKMRNDIFAAMVAQLLNIVAMHDL